MLEYMIAGFYKTSHVLGCHQESILTVRDHFWNAPHSTRDNWQFRRHCFRQDGWQRLGQGGEHKYITCRQQARHILAHSSKDHAGIHPCFVYLFKQSTVMSSTTDNQIIRIWMGSQNRG